VKITDSDRLQEEMTALGIPCFTIQESTERPVTIDEGTDTLDGTTAAGILSAYEGFKNGGSKEVDSRNIGMAKPLNESSIFFLAGPMNRFRGLSFDPSAY
jgi:UDP-N-acetylglucosamine 2-epimerase